MMAVDQSQSDISMMIIPGISGLAVTDIEVGDTIWKREFDRRWDALGKSRFQRSTFEFDPNYDPDNPPSYAKKYKEKGKVTKTVNVQRD